MAVACQLSQQEATRVRKTHQLMTLASKTRSISSHSAALAELAASAVSLASWGSPRSVVEQVGSPPLAEQVGSPPPVELVEPAAARVERAVQGEPVHWMGLAGVKHRWPPEVVVTQCLRVGLVEEPWRTLSACYVVRVVFVWFGRYVSHVMDHSGEFLSLVLFCYVSCQVKRLLL